MPSVVSLFNFFIENVPNVKVQSQVPSSGPKVSLPNFKKTSVFVVTFQALSKYLDNRMNDSPVASLSPLTGSLNFVISFTILQRSKMCNFISTDGAIILHSQMD